MNFSNNGSALVSEDYIPIVETIVIIIVVISTFVINVIVIAVILKTPNLKNITGYFIIALAASDLLYGACFSFSIPSVLLKRWIFGDTFCAINGYLYNVTYHNSIHSFVWVTIDRYIAITRPLHYHRIMTKKIAAAIVFLGWAVSFAAVSPTVLGFGSFAYRPDVYWCGIAWGRDWRYTVYCTCIFMPDLFAILFCYYNIWRISQQHAKGMQNAAFSNEHKDSRNKALRTLVVMGVSFLNGWFPYMLSMLYSGFSALPPIPYAINFAMGWGSTSNSFWDSFLYILSNQQMKQGTRMLFAHSCPSLCGWCDNRKRHISESNAYNNNPNGKKVSQNSAV